MRKTEKTELGVLRIHKDVIGSIAKNATLEIEGASRLSASSVDKFLELAGFNTTPGIKVEIDDANEVKISIDLIVKYGFHLSEVSHLVQKNVRKAIEKMTDLTLREVDVDIKGIDSLEEK